jgi:hypothetical protein
MPIALVLVDISAIEKLLEGRSLLPDHEVKAVLRELEEAALADLQGPSAQQQQARRRLKAITEYQALRAFAVRNGWQGSGADWPLRPEAYPTSRPPDLDEPTPAQSPASLEAADRGTIILKPA